MVPPLPWVLHTAPPSLRPLPAPVVCQSTPPFNPKTGEKGSNLRSLALWQINSGSVLQSDLPGRPDFSLRTAVSQSPGPTLWASVCYSGADPQLARLSLRLICVLSTVLPPSNPTTGCGMRGFIPRAQVPSSVSGGEDLPITGHRGSWCFLRGRFPVCAGVNGVPSPKSVSRRTLERAFILEQLRVTGLK